VSFSGRHIGTRDLGHRLLPRCILRLLPAWIATFEPACKKCRVVSAFRRTGPSGWSRTLTDVSWTALARVFGSCPASAGPGTAWRRCLTRIPSAV